MPIHLLRSTAQWFFAWQSDFARDIIQAPGNWRCLDRIYRNAPMSWIDRKLLGLRVCEGTRERLQAYRALLANAVETIAEDPVRVLDLGSGLGWAPMDVVARSSRKILVTCVDRDVRALEAGKALAERRGVASALSFRLEDIRRLGLREAPAQFHVVGTHGLLDYFGVDLGVRLLRRVRRLLKPQGVLVMSNIREHDDRVGRFLMEFVGRWYLHYKDEAMIVHMLDAAGYTDVVTSIAPMGIHVLATARTKLQ